MLIELTRNRTEVDRNLLCLRPNKFLFLKLCFKIVSVLFAIVQIGFGLLQ